MPLLRETALLIADPQVRYVGTIGGNAANGDPGNDMPAVMMTLGATYELVGKAGERQVAARDYYQGIYLTALKPGEMLTAIRIPRAAGRPRLRLREAEAEDRRLRHRGGRGGADDAGRHASRPARSASPMSRDSALFAEAAAKILTGSALDDGDGQEGRRRRRSDHRARRPTATDRRRTAPRWPA